MDNNDAYVNLISNPNWKDTIDLSDESLSRFSSIQLYNIANDLESPPYTEKAFLVHKYNADHGNADGAMYVGNYYLNIGTHSPENAHLFENPQLDGINYLMKASDKNVVPADLMLADLYKEGNIVVEDIEKELYYRLKVFNYGIDDFENHLRIAHIFVLLEDYSKALQHFIITRQICFDTDTEMLSYLDEQIADLQKMENLAKKYNIYLGNNVVRDKYYVKAIRARNNGNYVEEYNLYEKSANSGNASSYVEMAMMLMDAKRGIQQNMPMAIQLLQKAIELGNDRAKYCLACYYVDYDPQRAYQLYKESKKTYNGDTFSADGNIEYLNNNLVEALKQFDKAFEYGAYNMNDIFNNIVDMLKDPRIHREDLLAYYAYQANKMGIKNANEVMAECFENGYNLPIDKELAQAWKYNNDIVKNRYDYSCLDIKPDLNNVQQIQIEAETGYKNILNEAKTFSLDVLKGISEALVEGATSANFNRTPRNRSSNNSQPSSSDSSFNPSRNNTLSDADKGRIDARNHQYDNTNYSRAYQDEFAKNLSYDQYQKYKDGKNPFGY